MARDVVRVNVAWGVFNLLPIVPLDGGQALRSGLVTLWAGRGESACAGIGVVTAVACLGAAVLAGHGWAALVVAIYGFHNGQVFKRHYDAYRDAHTHTRWQKLSPRERASRRY